MSEVWISEIWFSEVTQRDLAQRRFESVKMCVRMLDFRDGGGGGDRDGSRRRVRGTNRGRDRSGKRDANRTQKPEVKVSEIRIYCCKPPQMLDPLFVFIHKQIRCATYIYIMSNYRFNQLLRFSWIWGFSLFLSFLFDMFDP